MNCRRSALAQHLRKHLQGEVRFDLASRQLYSNDASIYQIEPLGVVLPRTVADVVAAVQIAGEMEIPITPRGGGTSLSGQSIGPGIILDCSKYLNSILAIDPEARVARVQPGVVLDQLNRAAGEHGLQFGPDVATASRANLGGMIGNNSAGAAPSFMAKPSTMSAGWTSSCPMAARRTSVCCPRPNGNKNPWPSHWRPRPIERSAR